MMLFSKRKIKDDNKLTVYNNNELTVYKNTVNELNSVLTYAFECWTDHKCYCSMTDTDVKIVILRIKLISNAYLANKYALPSTCLQLENNIGLLMKYYSKLKKLMHDKFKAMAKGVPVEELCDHCELNALKAVMCQTMNETLCDIQDEYIQILLGMDIVDGYDKRQTLEPIKTEYCIKFMKDIKQKE